MLKRKSTHFINKFKGKIKTCGNFLKLNPKNITSEEKLNVKSASIFEDEALSLSYCYPIKPRVSFFPEEVNVIKEYYIVTPSKYATYGP